MNPKPRPRALGRVVGGMALLLGLASPASACLVCDSGTGEQVRAGVIDEHFARGVLATLLPFVIVGGVAVVMHRGLPGRKEPR